MRKVSVLVTSVGGFSHGSSIVRALLNSTIQVNIVGTDKSPKLINASPVKKKEVIPGAEAKNYMETILKLVEEYSIDCIFTGSEQELLVISNHRDELESKNVKVFLNNRKTIELCKDKFKCNEFLASAGFHVPRTILVREREDIEKVDFFPAVIKPYFKSGASVDVFGVKNKKELLLVSEYLFFSKRAEIIVQEYLPYNNNEYTVGVTSLLEKNKVVSSIAMRRFIEGPSSYINENGVVISSGLSQGEFKDFKCICKECERISQKVGSTGPLNIQLRVVKGKVIPFEINPRFSGTTSARAFNGYNEPEFYIRKYLLNDQNARESLTSVKSGFVVKGLDERYFEYE